ncbi:DUF5808 domain-containing protein, partial [Tsukamurella soli]|uniref:DUF5808 domain-containing protein n=1 Tax=Tsukamurella soli TaxID=644556 RepID=UPI0031EC4DB1
LAPDRDAAAVGGMLAAAAPLLLLVGALLALQAGRAVIARAKRDGGWYDGVPVRVGAEVIRPDGDGARTAAVPWLPFAAAATVIAVGVCLELALYDRFPTRIPQHVGPGGVTRWADKSVPAVLGPSLVAAVVVAAMWGLAWFTTRAPVRRLPDGDPAAAAARATAARRITLWVLGAAAVLVSLQLTATGLLLAAAAPAGTIEAVSGIGAVVIVGAIGVMVAVSVRTLRRTPAPGDTGPDSPDDDARWKLGVLYVASGDPAVLVPKRMGIGYTVNLGNPVGLVIVAAVLGLAVTAALLPVLLR